MPAGPADIPIIHTLYDAYATWHGLLLKFPKSERYTLGETSARSLLVALETVLAAAAARDAGGKRERLRSASAKIDAMKLLVRLTKECDCISNQQYLDMESRLQEAGRMLGGWLKSLE